MNFIFHMLICLNRDMTHIDIEVKGQGQKDHFCKNWFYLIMLRTVYHRGFTFHMFIGLVEGLTSMDFVFFRSKIKFTKVNFKKMVGAHFLENYLSQTFHI